MDLIGRNAKKASIEKINTKIKNKVLIRFSNLIKVIILKL